MRADSGLRSKVDTEPKVCETFGIEPSVCCISPDRTFTSSPLSAVFGHEVKPQSMDRHDATPSSPRDIHPPRTQAELKTRP
ncbi:hypothetical protein SODALDRAFT_356473 [Sodiomyces alkalinus F11]|uniref:Uncharacterized protein n=1 Tax=Sodiomyces alkalinus (strain CBS 110278 / VKM F-3762 / F11) TaxID=1314773 RepID=A0A3N2Q144_SODAK|nr:hypothetical protein SODALDRAFT_356473 [Sodiomyces alkalinus F11]ROT40484.1 hypothetical protein SODALDRAFT_356473 [Sodiomyces alkalinus F11]